VFSHDHVIGTSLDLVVWTADERAAQEAQAAALAEIERLREILDTRDPASEISRVEAGGRIESPDLAEVLALYDDWNERTGGIVSIRPRGPNTPRNVDALGKAFIIDRAAAAAAGVSSRINGVLVNIGGDLAVRGPQCDIAVVDPETPYDNAAPITRVRLEDAAIATSGPYARGAHLIDARVGRPVLRASSATVVGRDSVTANALATALCVADADEGLRLVERISGAEAIRIDPDGTERRTTGFWQFERRATVRSVALADWPAGYECAVSLTLTAGSSRGLFGGHRGSRRPYVAVWVETTSGKLVRLLAFWGNKAKYYSELSSFWTLAGRNHKLAAAARATREPGKYQLVWDGLDEDHRPTPTGTYRIVVETNQEHGVYAKQAGTIACEDSPASVTLSATANFDAVEIRYGPRLKQG
jgi:thiamine biosynthesis lipoprotein ApbE